MTLLALGVGVLIGCASAAAWAVLLAVRSRLLRLEQTVETFEGADKQLGTRIDAVAARQQQQQRDLNRLSLQTGISVEGDGG